MDVEGFHDVWEMLKCLTKVQKLAGVDW